MSDHEDEHTIAEDLVVTKYKMAGEIVNRVLKLLVAKCVPLASVRDICAEGDRLLEEETSKVFKKEKDLKKGIAFPVCASVNNCINHYSPLASEGDTILQDGDLVKIDMGAHIDGFIAVVGHTVVVGASKENKIKGRRADVMLAAHHAAEAALRLVKPGNQNFSVTDTVTKIAEVFKCKPVEGMLSFQLQQGRIDGEKTIIQNPTEAQRKEVEKQDFETHEVYGVDVIVSTGEGQGKEAEARVTVFRKTEESYSLKLKASREFFSKVQKNHGTMPFNIRSFDDEKKARLGVTECVAHKLVDPYPVLWEKTGEFVAQFKFTVLLMPGGQHKITGLQLDTDMLESDYKIEDPELKQVISASISNKAAKKKKKKAEKEAATVVKNED
ncbi:proliferation-associated protein 2G4 [Procambarus clarkii]|uniref:proliferation-associated protein 2G4 n=1 Tax=Procambarus clarkii TaxID=6728 RepID=UPI001E673902|nr:proliferation-associated protein 2G4-like [Procambarus clarkii]